jgi:hypothetical protein
LQLFAQLDATILCLAIFDVGLIFFALARLGGVNEVCFFSLSREAAILCILALELTQNRRWLPSSNRRQRPFHLFSSSCIAARPRQSRAW